VLGGAAAVIADAGPLHYLVLIGHIDVLPRLFGAVAVPATVIGELRHTNAPAAVRAWADAPPPWLAVYPDPAALAAELRRLDPGELAAIALAQMLGAALLLIDDRAGTAAARGLRLEAVGKVGLLTRAAGARLLDLPAAVVALRATNFGYPAALFEELLAEHRRLAAGQ
jgi:predicted nucleic acid-binding protein